LDATFLDEFDALLKTDKYRERFEKILEKDHNVFLLDFDDLSEEAGKKVQEDYARFFHGRGNIDEFITTKTNNEIEKRGGKKTEKKIRVWLKNVENNKKVRELSSSDINTLMTVTGVVTSSSSPRSILTKAFFHCPKCEEDLFVYQNSNELIKPMKCICGNKRGFILEENKSEWDDYQEIWLQENPQEVEMGVVPRIIKVKLIGKHLIDICKPGDLVRIVCSLFVVPRRGGRDRIFDWFLEANNIEVLNKNIIDEKLSEEEKEELVYWSSNPRIKEIIVDSIFPSIHGHRMEKYGLALAIFGGVEHKKRDIKHRGSINVLLVGDPSMAKTRMLLAATNAAPKCIYTVARGASGVGLTAAAIQDQNGWRLEAGPLVLADRGLCAIDELEKMDDKDRTKIHEAMSTGTVSIHKADKHMTLNARTGVIAAANPSGGRYDPYKFLTENISLPPTILSRFDLIFIIKDQPDEKKDRELIEKILNVDFSAEEKKMMDYKLLKKYILYSKTIKPKISQEALKKIVDFYIEMRKLSGGIGENPIPITARQGEGLRRLTEASARMALKSIADEEDAELAIELLRGSLEAAGYDPSSGKIDIGIIETGKPLTQEKKKQAILAELEKFPRTGLSFDELAEAVSGLMDRKELKKLLRSDALSTDVYSPETGRYAVI